MCYILVSDMEKLFSKKFLIISLLALIGATAGFASTAPNTSLIQNKVLPGTGETGLPVAKQEEKQPSVPIFRGMIWREAKLGFNLVGNCIPLSIVPVASLNLSRNFSIEVGAGAGYRGMSTVLDNKDTRDAYGQWFAQGVLGTTWRNHVPGLSVSFCFTALFQGVDSVSLGDPKDNPNQVPLFDGEFKLTASYSRTRGYNLISGGYSFSGSLAYYIKNYLTFTLNAFYGTGPFVKVVNSAGKHMFAMGFQSTLSFFGYHTPTNGQNIPDFFRDKYILGIRGGAAYWDQPFSLKWTNLIKFSGPKYYQMRPFGCFFVDLGMTWGQNYFNHEYKKLGWGASTGIEIGIAFFDYVAVSGRFTLPYPSYRAPDNTADFKFTIKIEALLDQV